MLTLASKTYHPFDLRGKSTDTKPTVKFGDEELENGDSFLEMDTGEVTFYDKETESWIKPE